MEIIFDNNGNPIFQNVTLNEFEQFSKFFQTKKYPTKNVSVNSSIIAEDCSLTETVPDKEEKSEQPYDLNGYYKISEIVRILNLPNNYYATLRPLILANKNDIRQNENAVPPIYHFEDVCKCIRKSRSRIANEALDKLGIYSKRKYTKKFKNDLIKEYKACGSYKTVSENHPEIPYGTMVTWFRNSNKSINQKESNLESEQNNNESNEILTYEQKLLKWKKYQYEKINDANLDVGKTISIILKKLTTIYGINWDQVKKDFYNYHQTHHKNMIELAYFVDHSYNEIYQNGCYNKLFENNLDDYISNGFSKAK